MKWTLLGLLLSVATGTTAVHAADVPAIASNATVAKAEYVARQKQNKDHYRVKKAGCERLSHLEEKTCKKTARLEYRQAITAERARYRQIKAAEKAGQRARR